MATTASMTGVSPAAGMASPCVSAGVMPGLACRSRGSARRNCLVVSSRGQLARYAGLRRLTAASTSASGKRMEGRAGRHTGVVSVLVPVRENGENVNSKDEKRESGNGVINGSSGKSELNGLKTDFGGKINGYTVDTSDRLSSVNGASSSPAYDTVIDMTVSERESNGAIQGETERKMTDEKSGLSVASSTTSDTQAEEKVVVAEAPGGRWNRFKTYSVVQRTFEIWRFVFTFVVRRLTLGLKWTYRGGFSAEAEKTRRAELARWVKENLLRLGPTFIKLGQQFSTRVDVLAPEFIKELETLQDRVPPFDSAVARQIVETELGKPIEEVFEYFEETPIAAASLGQVHRARLNGKEVVLKVQRPGLKDLFDIDLKNLRVLAVWLQKVDPKTDGAKRDWVAIYDECAQMLYREIDYRQEALNADEFRNNFAGEDWIKVPDIYWDYTTTRVLTMEYCPGVKINDGEALDKLGLDRIKLARYSVESYLDQILRHGFFHADPHPGNIAVDSVNGGRLVFYDFGMMGRIPSGVTKGMREAFYGIYEKDAGRVLDAMVAMGILVPTSDMVSVRRTAQFFINSFQERLKKQREEREAGVAEGFKPKLSKEEMKEKRKQRIATIGEDLLALSADQPFRFPATFTFVVRSFTVLDGIGKSLDPRFDITEIARPYVLEVLNLKEFGSALLQKRVQDGFKRQKNYFINSFKGPDRLERVDGILTRLEQGDLKLRTRVLESERQFNRVATMQDVVAKTVVLAALANIGTMLYLNAMRQPANWIFAGAAYFGVQVLAGVAKVKKLDTLEKQITGQA